MSYKPLSQTVIDGQKNPISSDAVHDHIASEISAIPASASLTLNNLTAPTAVNEDINLTTNKILITNGATKPTFTQGTAIKTDLILNQGLIASQLQANSPNELYFAVNAYVDNGVWKYRNTTSSRPAMRVRLVCGDGAIPQGGGANFFIGHANAGAGNTNITFTESFSVTHGGSVNCAGISASSIGTPTDNSGSVGSNYTAGRFRFGNFGSGLFARAVNLHNNGTGGQFTERPPGIISSFAHQTAISYSMVAPFPNNQNIVFYTDGNSGQQQIAVGDYVKLSGAGRTTIRQVTNVTTTGGLQLVLDGNIGDGVGGSVEGSKSAFIGVDKDKNIIFDVSPFGQTTAKNNNAGNIVSYPFRVAASSSSAPSAGMGAGIEFGLWTQASRFNFEVGATIEIVATDVTDTSENFDLVFKTVNGGSAAAERLRITSVGNLGIGTSTPTEKLEVSGNIKATSGDVSIATAGKGLKVAEGSDATMGVATLVAGTVVVPTTAVKSTSRIMLTTQSLGTVSDPKAMAVTARTADQDFTITSADNTDTSVIAWLIINPA